MMSVASTATMSTRLFFATSIVDSHSLTAGLMMRDRSGASPKQAKSATPFFNVTLSSKNDLSHTAVPAAKDFSTPRACVSMPHALDKARCTLSARNAPSSKETSSLHETNRSSKSTPAFARGKSAAAVTTKALANACTNFLTTSLVATSCKPSTLAASLCNESQSKDTNEGPEASNVNNAFWQASSKDLSLPMLSAVSWLFRTACISSLRSWSGPQSAFAEDIMSPATCKSTLAEPSPSMAVKVSATQDATRILSNSSSSSHVPGATFSAARDKTANPFAMAAAVFLSPATTKSLSAVQMAGL